MLESILSLTIPLRTVLKTSKFLNFSFTDKSSSTRTARLVKQCYNLARGCASRVCAHIAEQFLIEHIFVIEHTLCYKTYHLSP
jgi:hypothetical protein